MRQPDIAKARNILGWEPKVKLEEGLVKTIEYFRTKVKERNVKIVVTGGAGFIASHIVDAYIERGHEVHIFDDFSTGQRSNLNAQATLAPDRYRRLAKSSSSIEANQAGCAEPSCGANGRAPFGGGPDF